MKKNKIKSIIKLKFIENFNIIIAKLNTFFFRKNIFLKTIKKNKKSNFLQKYYIIIIH